ncbi:hypothetical protein llap_18083 [Limosa lapponica baueri]|uniref:Uncharacterized protein n=1 Tax=Limosa lapponica baueri TaxID=1758121 RepID=A0A2I0TCR5_LIMLA|nr:hypothetical protein llap_18083 [Limosa lapponica baueri]
MVIPITITHKQEYPRGRNRLVLFHLQNMTSIPKSSQKQIPKRLNRTRKIVKTKHRVQKEISRLSRMDTCEKLFNSILAVKYC